MPMSTKGQVELHETLLVTFFLVIIIVLGVFVYYRYFVMGVRGSAEEFREEEASVLLASLTALPEISCSHDDCVDTGKLIPFFHVVRAHPAFYGRAFGFKKVSIRVTYPESPSPDVLCDTAAYQQVFYPENCGYYVLYEQRPRTVTSTFIVRAPVSLFYPETGFYRVGQLEIESYA